MLISAAVLSILGVLGFQFAQKNVPKKQDQNQSRNDNKCDNIKELLDQKKKELEDMVRGWPEEKLKAMAQEKVLEKFEKDEDFKTVLDATESIKNKYDRLTSTIELLQKRFDLCMLSLPSKGPAAYQGTIIENSLTDKAILESIKVIKHYEAGDWSLHDVAVNEDQIKKLGEYLADGPWYMHFWQPKKDDVIVVFKDKTFIIKHSNKDTWNEAIAYGKSKGIPEDQMTFEIH